MFLQRKYIDLIRRASSKWVNWDPPIPIEVGAYGVVERDTGELRVEGNIYDPEFQQEIDKLGLSLTMSEHTPLEGSAEQEMIVASSGASRLELALGPQVNIAGLATASLSGQWQFEQGKRDALLIIYCPRARYIPPKAILDTLFKVPKLKNKSLVTSVYTCPAFSMYLSNKSGEKLSLALVGTVPVPAAPGISAGAQVGLDWWSDTHADLLRKACDKAGNYCYTPLYTLKRRVRLLQRVFRDGQTDPEEKVPTGDNLWVDTLPEWPPLDEDGLDDPVDFQEEDADEF